MKTRNYVNLNVNPCKMCMPMGAAIALKGIESCIMLLHGSQGCSTYIRRHMATHYNEPVDIASSSLNEKGTVYGGANNLKKAIKNVIKLYNPKIIGIATTCLAETIGEDIERIVQEFVAEENIIDRHFIPIATPGYGGSQHEGYYLTIRKVIERFAEETPANSKINIISGNLTPADLRNIKEIMDIFGVGYNLIPDFSETLDAPYAGEYKRIPDGGTSVESIKSMAGAVGTIEMGLFVNDNISPGKFLEENFGVALYKCPVPIGMEATDKFIDLISNISGREIPSKILKERGRLLDAMIDSHKFNSEGRAAIFGEPEIVYSVAKLCDENGIISALVATGTKITAFNENTLVLDDTDFQTIREYVKNLDVNLLIGHSDGKFITEKDGISLVRVGFPVHDRIGGQRKVFTGYNGSMNLLDEITNTIIASRHTNFRKERMNESYAA